MSRCHRSLDTKQEADMAACLVREIHREHTEGKATEANLGSCYNTCVKLVNLAKTNIDTRITKAPGTSCKWTSTLHLYVIRFVKFYRIGSHKFSAIRSPRAPLTVFHEVHPPSQRVLDGSTRSRARTRRNGSSRNNPGSYAGDSVNNPGSPQFYWDQAHGCGW